MARGNIGGEREKSPDFASLCRGHARKLRRRAMRGRASACRDGRSAPEEPGSGFRRTSTWESAIIEDDGSRSVIAFTLLRWQNGWPRRKHV